MKASDQRPGAQRRQRGAIMMFVLLAALLLSVVTLGTMRLVAGDITEGFGGLEAVQAFNIAEAGVHYAIGQLQQASGSDKYAGETITVTSGLTTLGTATITVNCIDTGGSPNPTPCSGTYAAYRRIISTATLPSGGALGGPTRTIVAVVQGTSSGGGGGGGGLAGQALCSLTTISAGGLSNGDTGTITGDVAANGNIDLKAVPGTIHVIGDSGSPQKYTGMVSSMGSITCKTRCSADGGLNANQSPGPLCTAPTLPTFTPGASPVTVFSGTTYTIDCSSGTCPSTIGTITVNQGTCAGATPFTTVQINARPNATDPPVVLQLNSYQAADCTRLMIVGNGPVDMRIGAATGMSLHVGGHGSGPSNHFGVLATDTYLTTAPVPASQLKVWVNSDGSGGGGLCATPTCAAYLAHTSGGATIFATNGTLEFDDHNSDSNDGLSGAAVAKELSFNANFSIKADTSGLVGPYATFNILRSWKDQ